LGSSRLYLYSYSTCILPRLYLTHRILGIPLYPCIYLHLAMLHSRSTVSCAVVLYLTVSSCIRAYLYLAVSSAVSRCNCISLYPTASITGYNVPNIHSRGGLYLCSRSTVCIPPLYPTVFSCCIRTVVRFTLDTSYRLIDNRCSRSY